LHFANARKKLTPFYFEIFVSRSLPNPMGVTPPPATVPQAYANSPFQMPSAVSGGVDEPVLTDKLDIWLQDTPET